MALCKDLPELFERFIVTEMIHRGLATDGEDPQVVFERAEKRDDFHKLASLVEADYLGGQIDAATDRNR